MSSSEMAPHESASLDLAKILNRDDVQAILASLGQGLDLLRDQLYLRVHEDVERAFGVDSMLVPVSEPQTERATKLEIDIFQVASSFAAMRDFGYVAPVETRLLPWLVQWRLPSESQTRHVAERLSDYLSKTDQERRLMFLDVLARTAHEARHTPLVLFRLYPRAIQVAVAMAFGDSRNAYPIREKQIEILPAIEGCPTCRGKLLANGAQCGNCGNPLWNYARMSLDA